MYLVCQIIRRFWSNLEYQSPTTDLWLQFSRGGTKKRKKKATLDESSICVGWRTAPQHFQQPGVVESAASKHNRAAIFTLDELLLFSPQQHDPSEQNLPQRVFFPSTVFHHDVGDRVRAEACKKTTLRQVTVIEEEWNSSTYTNCELKWKDKGKIQNIKVVIEEDVHKFFGVKY